MWMNVHTVTAMVVAAALLAAACGGSGIASGPPLPVLAQRAVAYLPSHTTTVTAASLEGDLPNSGLGPRLSRWGFVAGSQRSFQGYSRRLEVVVSRTLEFRTPSGARAYVSFVARNAGAYVGQVPVVEALTSANRRGVAITAPLCACHLASPMLLAVLSAGRRVTWLEVNGPAASRRTLLALVARAP